MALEFDGLSVSRITILVCTLSWTLSSLEGFFGGEVGRGVAHVDLELLDPEGELGRHRDVWWSSGECLFIS